LKTITAAFLLAQLLDIATTVIGINLPGVIELHPAGFGPNALLAKVAAMAGIGLILQLRDWPKAAWILPIISGLPALWNTLVILAEVSVI
jgi:hypothetical protein